MPVRRPPTPRTQNSLNTDMHESQGLLSRGAGSLIGKVVEVVASGVRALESSKSAPKRVPGPPRTGRDPSESRRSNSPTDLLPRCRRTLAFAGLRAGRPRHRGARRLLGGQWCARSIGQWCRQSGASRSGRPPLLFARCLAPCTATYCSSSSIASSRRLRVRGRRPAGCRQARRLFLWPPAPAQRPAG